MKKYLTAFILIAFVFIIPVNVFAAPKKLKETGEIIYFNNDGFANSNTPQYRKGDNDGSGTYFDSTDAYNLSDVENLIFYLHSYQDADGVVATLKTEIRDANTDELLYGPRNIAITYTDHKFHPFIWDISNCAADLSNAYIYAESTCTGENGADTEVRGLAGEIRVIGKNIGGEKTFLYPIGFTDFTTSYNKKYYLKPSYLQVEEKDYGFIQQNQKPIPIGYPVSEPFPSLTVDDDNCVYYYYLRDGSSSPGDQPFTYTGGVVYSNTFDITEFDSVNWYSTVYTLSNNTYSSLDQTSDDASYKKYLILLKEDETIETRNQKNPISNDLNLKPLNSSGEYVERPYIHKQGFIDLKTYRETNNITGGRWRFAFIYTNGGYHASGVTTSTPAILIPSPHSHSFNLTAVN